MEKPTNKTIPPPLLSSTEICEAVKGHHSGMCKVLNDIYGRRGSEARHEEYAYPEAVRRQAYGMMCELNRLMFTDFAELHADLGLGPMAIRGPCEHEKAK